MFASTLTLFQSGVKFSTLIRTAWRVVSMVDEIVMEPASLAAALGGMMRFDLTRRRLKS